MSQPISEDRAKYAKLLAEVVLKRAPEFAQKMQVPYDPDIGRMIYFVLAGDTETLKNKPFVEMSERFLDYLAMESLENDPSMTYSQYDASPNKQYALSEGGAANLQANREYNLARGMQTTGRHAAPGSSVADMLVAGAGSFFSGDMEMLYDARTGLAKDPYEPKAKEALYWWNRGEQADPKNPVWADGVAGAKLPEDSLSTFESFFTPLQKTDNPTGYAFTALENFRTGPAQRVLHGVGKLAYDIASGRPLTPEEYVPLIYDAATSFADLPAQQKVAHHTARKTPLMPDSPEKASEMKALGSTYEASAKFNQGSMKAYSPYFFEGLGMDRRYLTPNEEIGATALSQILLDPTSLLGGAGAAFAAAKAGKSLPKAAALGAANMTGPFDLATEAVFTGGPMLSAPPANRKVDPYKFSDQVFLDTSMGKQHIAADDPRFDLTYEERLRDERNRRYQMRQGTKQ